MLENRVLRLTLHYPILCDFVDFLRCFFQKHYTLKLPVAHLHAKANEGKYMRIILKQLTSTVMIISIVTGLHDSRGSISELTN